MFTLGGGLRWCFIMHSQQLAVTLAPLALKSVRCLVLNITPTSRMNAFVVAFLLVGRRHREEQIIYIFLLGEQNKMAVTGPVHFNVNISGCVVELG